MPKLDCQNILPTIQKCLVNTKRGKGKKNLSW